MALPSSSPCCPVGASPLSFKKNACFKCGDPGHLKRDYKNPKKCFHYLRFGHSSKTCKEHSPPVLSTPATVSTPPNSPAVLHHTGPSPPPSSSIDAVPTQGHRLKEFLPFYADMAEVSSYLGHAAFVETFGRPVKVDNVASTLAHKARTSGSWNTKKLAIVNQFFISCPSTEVVQMLMAARHIRGDGFTLLMNHWNQANGEAPHNLRFKVCFSLFHLPLICWNTDAIGKIITGFGIPIHASRSSMHWDDLFSFDLHLHCKDLSAIPESVDVTIGSRTHNVKVIVNYSSPLESNSLDSSSPPPPD